MAFHTAFGSLSNYEKGSIEIINDNPKYYVFSNVFEVASKARPYDEVKEEITAKLTQEKQKKAYEAVLARIKAASDVKINENVLASYPPSTFKVVPTPAEPGAEKAAPAPAEEE